MVLRYKRFSNLTSTRKNPWMEPWYQQRYTGVIYQSWWYQIPCMKIESCCLCSPPTPLLSKKYSSTSPRVTFRSNASIQYTIPWPITLEGPIHEKSLKGPINKLPCLPSHRWIYQIWRIWIYNWRFLTLWKISLVFINAWVNYRKYHPKLPRVPHIGN